MSPKAKAIAIVAAAAGLPFFTATIWWRFVPYVPFYDVLLWVGALAPALVAAFKAGPQAARAGLVVQAVVSVVLLKVGVHELIMRYAIHPHIFGTGFLIAGAAIAWKMIPPLDAATPGETLAPSAPAAPRAPSAPAAPVAPAAPRRSKMKVFLLVLGVLVFLGALGGSVFVLYRHFTRLDRTLQEIAGKGYGSRDEYDFLGEHGDDPRVHEYFEKELLKAGPGSLSGWELDDRANGMKATFARKKPADSKAVVDSIVVLALRDGKELPKEWLSCSWDDARVTEAVLERLMMTSRDEGWGFQGEKGAVLLAEVVRRKVPVTEDLVAAVAAIFFRSNGAVGKEWLETHAKDGPRAAAIRVQVLAMYKESYTPQPEPERKKRLEFLLAEIVRRCTGVLSDDVITGLMGIYLVAQPRELDEVVRSLGAEGARRLRERSAAEKQFHEKHISLVLACIAGHGEPADVASLLEQSTRPPVLDDDHWKKLQAEGFPPAIERSASEPWFHHTTLRGLVAIGKPGVAQLTSSLAIKTREVVRLCALALAQVEPAALVPEVEKQLDAYGKKAPLLAAATAEILGHGSEIQRARAILHEVHPLSEALAEGLLAIEKVAETDRVDLCFMRGLSSTDEAVAKHCANVLKKRLDRDKFLDVLFRFLVHKESFDVREVAVYEDAVKEFGKEASSGLARNLEKLLEQAGGNPSRVFWIHKVIALRCLETVGTADARPTIEKYAKDPGNYIHIQTKTDPKTKRVLSKTETEVSYKELCEKAIEAISKR